VTIEIGALKRVITLVPDKKRAKWTFKDATLSFTALAEFPAVESREVPDEGLEHALAADIVPTAPVTFHVRASGMPDAAGTVKFTGGKYRLGHRPGDLILPQSFRAPYPRNSARPATTWCCSRAASRPSARRPRVRRGAVLDRRPVRADGRGRPVQKAKNADTWTYKSTAGGTSFSVKIDFLRELVTVAVSKAELGTLGDTTTDIVFDAGDGRGAFRNVVRLSKNAKGTARDY